MENNQFIEAVTLNMISIVNSLRCPSIAHKLSLIILSIIR